MNLNRWIESSSDSNDVGELDTLSQASRSHFYLFLQGLVNLKYSANKKKFLKRIRKINSAVKIEEHAYNKMGGIHPKILTLLDLIRIFKDM